MEKVFDVTAIGELLIDFTENGLSSQGNPLLEANPGGAPCNVLALLNNYFTYYQLEKSGKKYGAGLLKLQRYDIEALRLPDITLFSDDDKTQLINLAKELATANEKRNIVKITDCISKYSEVKFNMIEVMYEKIRKFRLEGKE